MVALSKNINGAIYCNLRAYHSQRSAIKRPAPSCGYTASTAPDQCATCVRGHGRQLREEGRGTGQLNNCLQVAR
jgi:AhpD family alkylhydroperoxidase